MKKDIDFPEVVGIHVAIGYTENENEERSWCVYLVNENDYDVNNLLIVSKGYQEDSSDKKTSTLRHRLDNLPPKSFAIIELITDEVFHLYNEYWISFYHNRKIYDKKYIFEPNSINVKNSVYLSTLKMRAVLAN